jgi:hypothetical protein
MNPLKHPGYASSRRAKMGSHHDSPKGRCQSHLSFSTLQKTKVRSNGYLLGTCLPDVSDLDDLVIEITKRRCNPTRNEAMRTFGPTSLKAIGGLLKVRPRRIEQRIWNYFQLASYPTFSPFRDHHILDLSILAVAAHSLLSRLAAIIERRGRRPCNARESRKILADDLLNAMANAYLDDRGFAKLASLIAHEASSRLGGRPNDGRMIGRVIANRGILKAVASEAASRRQIAPARR